MKLMESPTFIAFLLIASMIVIAICILSNSVIVVSSVDRVNQLLQFNFKILFSIVYLILSAIFFLTIKGILFFILRLCIKN